MTIEEITKGESKNVEFKVILPKESEKYTKTIVAFANTQGGKIIIGIDDKSRKVVGVDNETAFEIMDSIANAVSDNILPQLIPNIELQTVDNKTVVVISVEPSMNRPYYLASKGKDDGTYIRVGGTTRPAHQEKIKELEMEGSHISWDELACIGFNVSEKQINDLCKDIMEYRKTANLSERNVGVQQLLNWKLLKKGGDNYVATNAFALLTSDYFDFSRTQCAVFKGKDRTVFIDKKEYDGPIYQQIDETVKFVLRNIRLGAKIEGLLRKEAYELPPEAIRELIINAHCHRSFADNSCVQVAIYDDRLEITSPGGLYGGLTLEEVLAGHSKLRNKAIANVFGQMGLVESWGTGLLRVRELAREYGLQEPEFVEMSGLFRVNLYRSPLKTENHLNNEKNSNLVGDVGDNVGDVGDNVGEDVKSFILKLISENNKISATEIAQQLSVSKRTAERHLKELRENGKLKHHGSARNGYWEVM